MTGEAETTNGGAPPIRQAGPGDLAAIECIVSAAFTPYIPRLGRPPGVMKNDYAALLAAGTIFVRTSAQAGGKAGEGPIEGLVVLVDEDDVLYVDTLAVDPAAHGRGHGRALLDFAAVEARRRGFPALRLCTNLVMTENHGFYRHLGWRETHRGTQAGFERVFYRKEV